MIYEYIDFKKITFESEDRRKREKRKWAKNKGKKKEKKEKTHEKNLKGVSKKINEG
ncbi:hypothetical protein LMG8526_2373 [Lactococcus lactis subsp. lactis]|nr:hypothetical protein LMG8526_2373 [Lactococcus lactis subsp. lactis]